MKYEERRSRVEDRRWKERREEEGEDTVGYIKGRRGEGDERREVMEGKGKEGKGGGHVHEETKLD